MARMKIAFFEADGWSADWVRGRLPGHEIVLFEDPLTALTLPARNDFDAISVFINSEVGEAALAHFPGLKLVATRSTGFDHIDRAACKARGIAACYIPGYGDHTVAEMTFGLLLMVTRKLYQGVHRVKEDDVFSFEGLRGVDLKGKTIAVIGAGRIGRETAKIAAGFSMRVVAYDPFPNLEWAASAGVELMGFEDAVRAADVITIHCPYTKDTHHLFNKETMKLVKRGAYLVNTARGAIIETEALLEALRDGTLAGAGLDVLEEENNIKDVYTFLMKENPSIQQLRTAFENHLILDMPNVVVTPHSGAQSAEALERIWIATMENIAGFAAGTPQNLIPDPR